MVGMTYASVSTLAPPVLLELKRICPNAVNYGPLLADTNFYLPSAVKWLISHLNFARDLLAKTTPQDLRRLDFVSQTCTTAVCQCLRLKGLQSCSAVNI